MTEAIPSQVLGRWRIIAIEGWSAGYVDLLGPGHIRFDPRGGEWHSAPCRSGWSAGTVRRASTSTSQAAMKGTEVREDGDADLEPDGTVAGELRFDNGDDMPFTARRW